MMNYANMIEEKNLKKGFIIATLASTVVGTFTASMALWDRVAEKRKQNKQNKVDSKQDDDVERIRKEFSSLKNKDGDGKIDKEREDVRYALERDSRMIQRVYNDMYGRMGSRFARGDAIAENQLQAQVIALQQTVINVLQDVLCSNRQLSHADMTKIVMASKSARDGSVDALRQAQKRLGLDPFTRSSMAKGELEYVERAPTHVSDGSDQLFCRYSLDLQYVRNKPLAASFAPGGNCQCPACGFRLDATAADFWMIGKCTPVTTLEHGYEREIIEVREFRLGQRFAVKCHTPQGEYACAICNRNRNTDVICRSLDALVKHAGTYHNLEELEREVDLVETPVDNRMLSLPAPRAIDLPLSRREGIGMSAYR